ncbi:MFS transporter [Fictibacillus gelatini]|uniref:MFS transporter n=1 Tax=Fictibacillus gelatini TaxID=225985 RepID=UPI00040D4799|nr:MFS transporter [Fictibacillus gelatini]
MNRYRAFWLARTLSFLGDYIFSITMIWLALQKGGAFGVAAAVSTAVVAKAFGAILLSPFVNLFGSRRTIIISDFLRMVVMIGFWSLTETDLNLTIYVLVGLNALFTGGFEAAMQAFIPEMSEDLRKANADLSKGRSIVQLIGLLAGGILSSVSSGLGFLINALTFFVAGLVLLFIRGGDTVLKSLESKGRVASFFNQLKKDMDGAYRAISASRSLRLIFWATFFINMFTVPMNTLIAPLVEHIEGGSILLGIVESSIVIGGLAGAYLVGKTNIENTTFLMTGCACCGTAVLLAACSIHSVMLTIAMALFGFAVTVLTIASYTVIQANEEHLRAPVFAVLQFAPTVLYPVISLFSATLAEWASIRLPFASGAFFLLVTFFVLLTGQKKKQQFPALKRKEDQSG